MAEHVMTVRLPATLAEDLALVANCDGETVADAYRAAVNSWIELRRAAPDFQAALRRRIETAERLLTTPPTTGGETRQEGP